MRRPISVKELNQYIKRGIITDPILKNVYIVGEVSNFRKSNYVFFDLKEDQELISCVYFSDRADISSGDQVEVKGAVSIYPRSSKYQIIVKSVENIGLGLQAIELEKLKNKLAEKGYFDSKYKKEIPAFPINIGLITSDKSAAFTDFISIISHSYPLAKISLYSSLVQGDQAKDEICMGLKVLDKMSLDLIVLTRGGGSHEDLGVFLEEEIADAIFALNTPIISALGHERDLSIADLVSDLRLSTPTKAAEYIARNYILSKAEINSIELDSKRFINRIINQKFKDLELARLEIINNSPIQVINNYQSIIKEINYSNRLLIGKKIQAENNKVEEIRQDIEEVFRLIQEKYMIKIMDLKEMQMDLKDVVIGDRYYISNDFYKYKIEILERVDD